MANDTKKRYGFVIDVSRCIDCRACMVACSVENTVPYNHTRIWVHDQGVQGEWPNFTRSFVPYNCMHCENPPCTEVCVSGATYKNKDNGLVLVDQEACIGCGFCAEACPYDVRYIDEKRGVVDKCNGCFQRVETGQMPACVSTCVGGSRLFGDFNDPESSVSKALKGANSVIRLDARRQDGKSTEPNIYYINAPAEMLNLVTTDKFGQIEGKVPEASEYTLSEELWKKLIIPMLGAATVATIGVQAVFFTKQMIEGEKEFED
ncbi:MAG TPA: 4Fe-4S dicluster domain-containing protein [Anaerolineales bacterium]|jgi:tetrathionate reductase subunit B